jgi:chromosome condensin MukBEF MukE localization factor
MLGHICSGITPKIAKIRPDEVQTMIDEDKVLKIGNKKATKWVVMHEDVAEKLAIQVRGKMHIEIFSAMEPKDQ